MYAKECVKSIHRRWSKLEMTIALILPYLIFILYMHTYYMYVYTHVLISQMTYLNSLGVEMGQWSDMYDQSIGCSTISNIFTLNSEIPRT